MRLFLCIAAGALSALVFPGAARAGFLPQLQLTGNLHLEVTGAASLAPLGTGTLTLATAPQGIVQKAYLYATQTSNTAGMAGTFGGLPLAGVGPAASDMQLVTISTYRWDVTTMIIPGVTSYSFTLTDGMGMPAFVAGVGLLVVWDDPSTQPFRTVTIVDGAQQVGENGSETESMTFTTVPAGTTSVWVFTTDDDASLGEVVSYNGVGIGGPLIGNLGLNASVLQMPANSQSGSNTLSIFTQSDHLTWVLGAIAVDQSPVGVERTSWGGVKAGYR
jgi:hypothetical protein